MPGARHRDAGALERLSPKSLESTNPSAAPARRIVVGGGSTSSSQAHSGPQVSVPRETLIVASKLKDYIRARSEMNTAASVMDALSEIVRLRCDEAIDRARREGRKTVLDRDFKNNT